VVIEGVALGLIRRMLIVGGAILRVSFRGELCVRSGWTVALFPVWFSLIDLPSDDDPSTMRGPGGN
jgi:hypothetical protein